MLFESLREKLESYPELNSMLYSLLFTGKAIVYNYYETSINIATMFGFVKMKMECLQFPIVFLRPGYIICICHLAEMQKNTIDGKTIIEAIV